MESTYLRRGYEPGSPPSVVGVASLTGPGMGWSINRPVHRFRLELPAETLAATLAMLAEVRAVPHETTPQGASFVLEGDIPAEQVHALTRLLPGVTHGEGPLETNLDHYRPVTGIPPSRPRTDANPLDRKAYLLRVTRRASG
jgi:ribosomal protection tetracycline resistance protein